MSDFQGEPTHLLENDYLKLEYLENSCRIVRLFPKDKENIFAELKREPVSTPFGDFYFRGGHRLWHAPEDMPRTYIPDNVGGEVSNIPKGVRIQMPTEPWTNITKAIEIELNPEKPQVILRHELRNDSPWPIEFAPWALSMFKQGGVGIFPQPIGNIDEFGLLSNRNLSLWPYMEINDPRLVLRDDFILVQATPSQTPIKFGYYNSHGWMGYWINGTLFIKRFTSNPQVKYPDNGCNAESYCNHEFIELESLGELAWVEPGESVFHNELWEIYNSLEESFIPSEIQELVCELEQRNI
jgi:hypothetical protein